jgi:hypothetical protein
VRLGEKRCADGGRGKDQPHEQRVNHYDAEIAGPPPATPDPLMPARRQKLPQRHGSEDAGKGTEADSWLICEQELGHRHLGRI